ncbi:MAG: hypothetical protein OXP73_01895 [Chloroflexota bacterium]|nr:hypothetical protein [Chloroflexota bacterium]
MAKDKAMLSLRLDRDLLARIHEVRRAQNNLAVNVRAMHTLTTSEAARILIEMGLREWEERLARGQGHLPTEDPDRCWRN